MNANTTNWNLILIVYYIAVYITHYIGALESGGGYVG